MANICNCPMGDYGNDGICNKCNGGIVCTGCYSLPCTCSLWEDYDEVIRAGRARRRKELEKE